VEDTEFPETGEHILQQIFDQWQSPLGTVFLLGGLHAAEFQEGLASCLNE
jgi:hypothetical protein